MSTDALEVHPRWRPSLTLWLSAILHCGALAAILLDMGVWPWALAIILANQAVLIAAGLLPRSRLLGHNWVRLPAPARARHEVAITIDDGPDPEVTPAVLDVLDHYRAHATFFCIGHRLARYPQLAREIVARGHTIENHSENHKLYFSLFGPRRIAREIDAAQSRIAGLVGIRPLFFRAPAGLRNFLLDYVLTKLGLELVSWTRRGFDTVNANPDSVLQALQRDLAAGDILLLHDGNAARSTAGPPIILSVLPRLLADLRQRGLMPVTLRSALR